MRFLIVILLLITPFISNADETYTYNMPDIREDYCGVEINYRYCKCAFHGDYCNSIDQTESATYRQVTGEFYTWVGDQIESMARSCIDDGNRWSKSNRTCTIVEDAEPKETRTIAEQYNLPGMVGVPEPAVRGYYGKISQADGEVFVYQWAFKRWVRARPGMPIYGGDFIKTLSGDTRMIYNGRFGEDVINLAPETMLNTARVNPEQPREENASVIGIVQEGAVELYNTLQEAVEQDTPAPEWYRQLHTPNVAPGIRGSHVIIAYEAGTEETTMAVNEGIVEFNHGSASGTVSLVPGDQATIQNEVLSTSTITSWLAVATDHGLLGERVDATPEEINHTAPVAPVDNEPAQDTGPSREELVGDLSDIEDQLEKGSVLPWVLVIVLMAGAMWFWRKRQIRIEE